MADFGIFGKGGGSWLSKSLNKFHGHTKKYDPIGHYSVEAPLKSAHWLVEKSSKGLADAGIGEGFNRRLSEEADENGNNFGLGSQRMAAGIGTVLAGMYGYGLAAGEGAGGAAGSGAGAGGYMEAGGGVVSDAAGGGFSWTGGAAGNGSTGALGQGGGWQWGNMLKQGGGTMQNMGQAQQQAQKDEIDESDVRFERPDYEGDPYAYSSKQLKGNPQTSMREVMRRGAAGADAIDQNGVHMAAIQALTKKVIEAKARVEQLKGKRA